MACCGLGDGCGVPGCYLCSLNASIGKRATQEAETSGKPDTRDGEPKLAGMRERTGTASARRAGPNWVPRERRVVG